MEKIVDKAEFPDMVKKVDKQTFKLQYLNVEDISAQVGALLTDEVGSMTVNDKSKTIIVFDRPRALKKIAEVVATFDVRPKQVVLQGKVIEVELSDQFQLGVNWDHVLNQINPRSKVASHVPLSANVAPSLSYQTILGGGDLSIVVDALKTVGTAKVVQNPKIAVASGESAMIKVVRKQPYKEVEFESGSTSVVGVTYKTIEIGTILDVAPVVNDDGFITVKIHESISELIGWYDASAGQEGIVGIPEIKEAEATTTLSVKDGVTIIIGGMIKEEDRENVIGVPVLKSIPLIGALFRSTVTEKKTSETFVLLTPRIITGETTFIGREDLQKSSSARPDDDSQNEETTAEPTKKEMIER